MRLAIVTKYLGPTNTRGARVKAVCAAGSITEPWQQDWSVEENHRSVAEALQEQYGWELRNRLEVGSLPKSTGFDYVYTQVPKDETNGARN